MVRNQYSVSNNSFFFSLLFLVLNSKSCFKNAEGMIWPTNNTLVAYSFHINKKKTKKTYILYISFWVSASSLASFTCHHFSPGLPSATRPRLWRTHWTLCGKPLRSLWELSAMGIMTGKYPPVYGPQISALLSWSSIHILHCTQTKS